MDASSSFSSSISPSSSTVQLANGVNMPLLGLGTTHSGGYYHDTVLHALRESGYRAIDTARRYGVEWELGVAIRDCGISRDDLFLSTKLWPTDFCSGVVDACRKSCENLGVDSLDLYMLHFPDVPSWFGCPKAAREETWRQMERLYDEGILRSIGTSNFEINDLEEMEEYASVLPHVNQSEFHPLYDPVDLRRVCSDMKVLFTGYCPLAKGKAVKSPVIQSIAERLGRSPAQVCLRWSIEHGVPVIPKSRATERVEENASIFDFSLSPSDHSAIASLNGQCNKIIRNEGLEKKWLLPDGYKLEGRVFGLPKGATRNVHHTPKNIHEFPLHPSTLCQKSC